MALLFLTMMELSLIAALTHVHHRMRSADVLRDLSPMIFLIIGVVGLSAYRTVMFNPAYKG
ncbi:hypothetical protein [Mangrovibrevibacter kandeliae]|uniref:hypothetical protein n=1 Tax=Mangrovibrevibacter kandeliae TaxID=2968473 RepID=UPI0021177C8F|nr:hypothetical protein [Aurantimonas sp. CSK15Z-1]MCQ8782840.1 hypothetical protein [Aurantimonas sp. CSK15Z-1]